MTQLPFARMILQGTITLLLAALALTEASAAPAKPAPADLHIAEQLRVRLGASQSIPLWDYARWTVPANIQKHDFTIRSDLSAVAIAHPQLLVFRPRHPNGRAILSIPGGAYQFVSIGNEGLDVAKTFLPLGYTVFVLVYRLPSEGWDNAAEVAFEDGRRAVRLIRYKAADFGVDPAKIGIIGFSAGGQLASDLATSFDRAGIAARDEIDTVSPRPDWAALIFPVVLLEAPFTHTNTYKAIAGSPASADKLMLHGAIHHIGAKTPPMFLLHAADDPTVPVQNSLLFAQALIDARIPVELHVIPQGGHGFGVGAARANHLSGWSAWLVDWLGPPPGNLPGQRFTVP